MLGILPGSDWRGLELWNEFHFVQVILALVEVNKFFPSLKYFVFYGILIL